MTVKKKLGRGLDALLGGASNKAVGKPAINSATSQVRQDKDGDLRHIPIDLIQRGKYQPRTDMHEEALQSLAASTGLTPVVDWARAHDFVASMAANTVIGSAWFLGSCLFYKNSSEEYKRRSGEFFAEMHRPVDFAK